ncbi:hypothetical protein EUTSA_v10012002mg [Eutrema salsugineum]|uniref:F-box domain-containing protein n=1 Tax=Eutrema salsugineum TaxID=72664 RepID=V4KSN3_EUTSA|nr:hypothetical protein EUTSA_v10012002mg [Eutrema salsugineum]
MEQQEEKKRKIPRKTPKQSKPTSSFPLDLTSEILLRLPAKSVVRFRCVSKFWSSITPIHVSPSSGNPIIWNPSMRQFLPLPKPEGRWDDIKCCLGYDPIEDKHKILEDAEKHEWSCKHLHAPFQHYDPSLEAHFHFNGFTHAGGFVYVLNGFYKSLYILFYDPEKNSFRKVEFKGVGDGRFYPLHTFQNHIETLKSL